MKIDYEAGTKALEWFFIGYKPMGAAQIHGLTA